MRKRISTLIAGYEAGISTRDELVDQLAALAGDRGEPTDSDSTFTSIGLNHVALAVSDVAVMADFMGRHLGTTLIRASDSAGFVACGANNFVGLFRRERTGLDHVCFSVEGYEPDRAIEVLEKAGLSTHRNEDRVFFPGPDGILFQVADTWGDYPSPD